MIHTPCHTMSFSVCCWSCNNEYDIVLLVMYVNVCWSYNNEYDNVLKNEYDNGLLFM